MKAVLAFTDGKTMNQREFDSYVEAKRAMDAEQAAYAKQPGYCFGMQTDNDAFIQQTDKTLIWNIVLVSAEEISVPVKDGRIRALKVCSDYPGIDVEYIKSGTREHSRGRVLFEDDGSSIRMLIYSNSKDENYDANNVDFGSEITVYDYLNKDLKED